jgi:multisubunit Na+/H+ antiporter MnhC subunit
METVTPDEILDPEEPKQEKKDSKLKKFAVPAGIAAVFIVPSAMNLTTVVIGFKTAQLQLERAKIIAETADKIQSLKELEAAL